MHRPSPAGLLLLFLLSCSACDKPNPQGTQAISFAEIDPLLNSRDVVPAQQKLEALLAQNGPDPRIVVRLSRVDRALGDPSTSVALLKDCLEKHPKSGIAWQELADLYGEIGMLKECRDCYLKARENGMSDAEIALPLGSCLGRLGDHDGAAREFERAHAAGVDDKYVVYNQALALYAKKDLAKARQLLEEILVKQPDFAEAKRELARVLLHGAPGDKTSVDRAMSLLWDAKDSLPEDWHLYEVMGDGWLILGDWDAAVDAYTNALRYGHNPKQIEDKYVEAKTRQNAARKKAGETVPPPAKKQDKPK